MKTSFLSVLTLVLTSIFTTSARAADGSSGCGAGWYLFTKNSLVSSYLRSTTNASFSNTIGMTFGTSNCAKHDLVKNEKEGQYFAEANYPNLVVEVAQGSGEHLQGYAAAMGCSQSSVTTFESRMQKSFETLVPEQGASADQFHMNVQKLIQSDPLLLKECSAAIS